MICNSHNSIIFQGRSSKIFMVVHLDESHKYRLFSGIKVGSSGALYGGHTHDFPDGGEGRVQSLESFKSAVISY